jgi:hypothetical protein
MCVFKDSCNYTKTNDSANGFPSSKRQKNLPYWPVYSSRALFFWVSNITGVAIKTEE